MQAFLTSVYRFPVVITILALALADREVVHNSIAAVAADPSVLNALLAEDAGIRPQVQNGNSALGLCPGQEALNLLQIGVRRVATSVQTAEEPHKPHILVDPKGSHLHHWIQNPHSFQMNNLPVVQRDPPETHAKPQAQSKSEVKEFAKGIDAELPGAWFWNMGMASYGRMARLLAAAVTVTVGVLFMVILMLFIGRKPYKHAVVTAPAMPDVHSCVRQGWVTHKAPINALKTCSQGRPAAPK